MKNEQSIKVGSRVMVEQAWEDESGAYHDDFATVTAIDDKGELTLKWDDPKVDEFLKDSDGYTTENVEKIN